jgi:predicted transcriptional regulator of viral defense system
MNNLLKKLKNSPFNVAYAQSRGVSSRMLIYYTKKGDLVRLSHGVYAFPSELSFDFESLVKEKMVQAPQGILGMNSALKLYGLTENDLPTIDLMVPEANIPKKKMEDVKLYSVADHLFNKGVTKVRGIKVTTIERTIVDILKRKGLAKDGRAIILEAQKKKIKINFGELERLATLFQVKSKFISIIDNL